MANAGSFFEGVNISQAIRTEQTAAFASKIATLAPVRESVLPALRQQQQAHGLVADGRDMGTVVFPHATLKFYLMSDPLVRARRRFMQSLESKQTFSNSRVHVPTLQSVLEAIQTRDERDQNREIAPLKPASNAFVIDTSHLSINAVLQLIVSLLTRY